MSNGWISRRELALLLGAGGAALAAGLPERVHAQARRNTLVLGVDISDTISLDPGRMAQYTPPMTLNAAYASLVTFAVGNYYDAIPALAESWSRTADGKALRIKLREAKFASGNLVTADDVKWTLDRVKHLKDQPALYNANIDRVAVVDPRTVDIFMIEPGEPVLGALASTTNGILERKIVEAQGGTSAVDANTTDKATAWLNDNSAGAGAYRLTGWQRNQQIQLVRNPHYYGGTPGFERILIRHMSESAAQLLAVQRGDIDAAFNLIPEQIQTLKGQAGLRVEGLASLDFVYLGLTTSGELNKALAVQEARQAIAAAIDYDGIRDNLLGGVATRCAHFLPIGLLGSTEKTTRDIGPQQNLDRARMLLQKAGFPDGFEFEVSYGNAAVSGLSYSVLAQKLQADLARVGIRMKLNPMDQVNLRTQYTTAKSTAVLTFWNPAGVRQFSWATSTTERVAGRLRWTPPADIVKLVKDATLEQDLVKQEAMWIEYQRRMVEVSHLIILFQPIYQTVVRDTAKTFPLTAAGYQVELEKARP